MGRNPKPSQVTKRLGERIRELRASHAMSQRELAARAELSTSALSMIELGERGASIAVLERLARSLDTRITSLLDDLGEPPPETTSSPILIRIMERLRNADDGELRAVEHLLAALDEAVEIKAKKSRARRR